MFCPLAQVFRRTLVCKMASTLEAEPFTQSFQLCFQTAGLMEAGILASNFLVCPRGAFPGAQALLTSCADVIAGLIFSIHEAKRVRDMRKYPFWARGAIELK